MNTSTSLFAKALATENIFVAFEAGAHTASFDVESRTLIIPDWKISNTLRDMVVAHEVAHALYTPQEGLPQAVSHARSKNLNIDGYKACLNVIEDARIERLIKEKFPGCRRDFYSGYKEIIDTDLFKLRDIDPASMTIVDKINLHFKFGVFGLMHFDFTAAEQNIIDRVANTQSFDEVVEIANELYAMAAEEEKQRGKTGGMFSGAGAKGVTDVLSETAKRDGLDNAEKGKHSYEDFPYLSYALPKCNSEAAIIPFKIIAEEYDHAQAMFIKDYGNRMDLMKELNEELTAGATSLAEYRSGSRDTVKELVAQFERRKAAEQYRKERLKPTGMLNPDRLHQFKTHDDIFLKNLIKHEGKKHGMVMLIDWSGSMSECMDGLIRQVLLLTWFCRKAKIPYEVFFYTEAGFLRSPKHKNMAIHASNNQNHTANMTALYGKEYVKTLETNGDCFGLSDVCLRCVFSSAQTDAEAAAMEERLWMETMRSSQAFSQIRPDIMRMHGTPSCEALMAMHDYLPKFREATGSQVVDFIFITDGEPTGCGRHGGKAYRPVKGVRVQNMATGRTLNIPASKRFGEPISLQNAMQYFLADEIRKLGVVTVGFSIGNMSGLNTYFYQKFLAPPAPDFANPEEYRAWMEKVEKNTANKEYNAFYKKENFIPALPSATPGFDEYYIIRPVKPTNSEMDESINANNSTLTKIRNSFLKSLNLKKCSRVFLSRFIDLMAGRKVTKFKH